MPGYVLAKLEMNDDVYHLVKNTPKVTASSARGGKPPPGHNCLYRRCLP